MKKCCSLAIVVLCLWLPAASHARSPDGVIIFGAWWDSNHDGVVLADTDIHSLFQLENDPDGVHITPVTKQEGTTPLVRPDGLVPFYLDRTGALHNASRIISREQVVDSAYTPDGARLVILTQAASLPNRAVSVVDSRTGLLVQFTGANVDDTDLSLSPDGNRVLFTQTFFGVNRLYMLDMRTGAVLPLTDGSFRVSAPRWSPNGAAIAYVRQVDNNRRGYDPGDPRTLWVSDPNGVGQRQVSPPGAVDAGAPLWSPDSFHVAFLNRSDNDANGRISPADALQFAVADLSTGIVNIVAAGIEFSVAIWNPSGTRLAFRGTTTDTNGDGFISTDDAPVLWVMRSNDAVATPLSGGSLVAGGSLAWSPDGNTLAYTIATHDDNADGKITPVDATQLYIAPVDADLRRPDKPLLDGPRIGAIAWSPDGASIAIIAQTSNSLGTLIRVTVANAALAPLTDNSLLVDPATGLHWVR
jgi:Tol biopolymer transport system component